MFDTNSWTETITRAEFDELYDRTLTDDEWTSLYGALENAVADIVSGFVE